MISSYSQNSNVSTSCNITATDEMQCERNASGHLQVQCDVLNTVS